MGIRFGHISDMHLAGDQASDSLVKLKAASGDQLGNTKLALQELATEQLGLLIMTGDLVHEGTAGDYAALRALIEQYLPGVPVISAMGNHDVRSAYREGFLGMAKADDSPYIDTLEVVGWRIISIDSAWEKLLMGGVNEPQLDWLAEVAQQPIEKGNILICHHPFCPTLEHTGMPLYPKLEAVLRTGAVKAIFNGHLHKICTGWAAGVPHFTGQSLAFDIETLAGKAIYTTRGGYNMCCVDREGHFFVESRIVSPKGNIYQTKPI